MQDLIAHIYQAANGAQPWGDVLTRITDDLKLLGSQMVGVSSGSGAILFSHASAGVPVEAELEYVRTYHAVDPRIPLLAGLPLGDWLYDEDVFDASTAAASPYYRDLLVPFGGRHTASAKLLERNGEQVLIGFLARANCAGFSDSNRSYLGQIALHLCEAAALYQNSRALAASASVGAALLDRMPRPSWLMATDRTITSMNLAARRYLESGTSLFLLRDQLAALNTKTDLSLRQAFEAMACALARTGTAPRQTLRLFEPDGTRAAALSLTAFVPRSSMYAFGPTPQVLVVAHEMARKNAPDVLLWEAAFDLTPAQSRVAREVFNGHTVGETAQSLHIADTTVKSHLRELFAKTGTRRQSQLVLALAALQ